MAKKKLSRSQRRQQAREEKRAKQYGRFMPTQDPANKIGLTRTTDKESGLTLGEDPPSIAPIPPNFHQWPIPNFKSFVATYQMNIRAYRYTFDEAMRQSRQQALYMGRDTLIYACLRARQYPTTQFPWHMEPEDPTDNAQVEAAETIKAIIEGMPGFQSMRRMLLDSIYFGRSAVQLVYDRKTIKGRSCYVPISFKQVNGDKLVFKWDGSGIGIRVNPMFYDGDYELDEVSPVHFLSPIEREATILCQFEPFDNDYFEPMQAGAIEGLGLRGRLYWIWFLLTNIRGLLYNYLERTASGTWLGFYDQSNPQSYEAMKQAFEAQLGSQVILMPRSDIYPNNPNVQFLEASASPATVFTNEIDRLEALIQFAMLGQELMQDTAPTGLGSGVAEAHEKTFDRYLRADAEMLQDALNRDFISVLYKWNFPDVPVGRMIFDIDKPNVGELLEVAQAIFQMGGGIPANWLMQVGGIPQPDGAEPILSQMQSVQPTAVGAVPQGVPAVGNPNAAGGQQQIDPNQLQAAVQSGQISPQDAQAMLQQAGQGQQQGQQPIQQQPIQPVSGVRGAPVKNERNGHAKKKVLVDPFRRRGRSL